MLVSRPSNEIQFDLHINRKVPYGCNYAYRKNSVHRIGDRTMGRFDRATVDVGRWTSEIVRRRSFSSSCAFAALLSTTLAERRGRNVWSFRLSAAPSFVDIFCPPRSYLTYKKMADTDRASCIIIRPTRARNTSLRATILFLVPSPLDNDRGQRFRNGFFKYFEYYTNDICYVFEYFFKNIIITPLIFS